MFYKKKMLGGDGLNSNPQIESFLAIIIIGYFSIKIIYPFFFNYYPEKYYFNNININTNDEKESTTENITLNAYVPGMWNNEITDFITLVVLSYIIFVFTHFSNKSCIDNNGRMDLYFLIGYIIGLGYPILKNIYNQINISYAPYLMDYFNYIVLSIFIIYIIIINYLSINNENNGKINYLIFIVAFVLLFFGLIIARKKSNNYSVVNYFYNDGESCSFNKKNNSTTGILQSSGDVLKITFPFIVFIILLLFSSEPSEIVNKSIYIFMYGLLLGSLVSSISYYGFEYFLEKKPLRQCNTPKECKIKEIDIQNYSLNEVEEEELQDINKMYIDINLSNSTSNYFKRSINKYSWFKLILLIGIISIIIYLIYFYLKK